MGHSLEPVGDGHHHIEGSQQEHEVEIGIAINGAFLLVVNDPWPFFHILLLFGVCEPQSQQESSMSEHIHIYHLSKGTLISTPGAVELNRCQKPFVHSGYFTSMS